MTSTTGRVRAATPVASTAARAVLAGLLAIATTFWPQPDRTAGFGLGVLAAYLPLQAVVLGAALHRSPEDRTGRLLLAARALASLGGGLVALVGALTGAGFLVPLEAVVFLVVGLLEFGAGMRRSGTGTAGDAVVVGGLQAVVGVLCTILNTDVLLAVGLLSAWSALVAVYLGIAAVTLHRRAVAEAAP